jgi:hypothetical protein
MLPVHEGGPMEMNRASRCRGALAVPRARQAGRVAVFFDLENLAGTPDADDAGLVRQVEQILEDLSTRGDVVSAIGYANRHLAPRIAPDLGQLGVRTFVHRGGPDAADLELITRMRAEVPESVHQVVIVSGDHIFATTAQELRARGKHVEVQAQFGKLSADLYRAADACRVLAPVVSEMELLTHDA